MDFLKQEGRGDVMSVSELKGHFKEPPLGGESGPGWMDVRMRRVMDRMLHCKISTS